MKWCMNRSGEEPTQHQFLSSSGFIFMYYLLYLLMSEYFAVGTWWVFQCMLLRWPRNSCFDGFSQLTCYFFEFSQVISRYCFQRSSCLNDGHFRLATAGFCGSGAHCVSVSQASPFTCILPFIISWNKDKRGSRRVSAWMRPSKENWRHDMTELTRCPSGNALEQVIHLPPPQCLACAGSAGSPSRRPDRTLGFRINSFITKK